MAKINGDYETLFVLNPTLPEEELTALTNKFTGLIAENGTIEKTDIWGKRRMAYPINDIRDGYYVLINFKSAPSFPAELDRVYGITDGVFRNIIIAKEE